MKKFLITMLTVALAVISTMTGYAAELNSDNTTLYDVLQTDTTEAQTYNMTKDEVVLPDSRTGYGTMKATDVTVNGNGHGINGGGKQGLTINTGQSLTLQNVGSATVNPDGSYTVNSSINGFSSINNGTIYNNGTMDINNVVFYDNYSIRDNKISYQTNHGGAIANYNGSIKNVTGSFIGNYSVITTLSHFRAFVDGGAIYNDNVIGNISADFVKNYILAPNASAQAGAVSNTGSIGNITGNFVGNYAYSHYYTYGGAISMRKGTIDTITGNFVGNYAESTESAAQGGAMRNDGTIGNITGDFINNYTKGVSLSDGGAIQLSQSYTIGDITGDFIGNHTLATTGQSRGGAIRYRGTIGQKDANGTVTGGIINANFINNYTKSDSGVARGGAIWMDNDLNIIADGSVAHNNGTSTFQGNYTQAGNNDKDYQAFWVDTAGTTLNFEQKNDGEIYMYDNINGVDGYNVNIKGDGTGTFYMYNDIKNANVIFDNTTINTVNNQIHTYYFNSLNIASNTKFVADVDLQNEVMDHIETGNNYSGNGKLTVSGMNLLNDSTKDYTKIFFAESNLAQNVDTTVKQVAYSPIYKYDVNYLVDDNNKQGYFTFARHISGGEGNSYDNYNPAVATSPVAAQSSAQSTMSTATNFAFYHLDTFTKLPELERTAMINSNTIAMNKDNTKTAFSSTPYNNNLSPIDTELENRGVWIKPYAVFENIPLKHGPKVDSITYGTLIGYDSNFHKFSHGWTGVTSTYIGYNGSTLDYSGIDTTTNGGLLGLTQTFYKGNFFTALTVTAGAQFAEAHTMYGTDNMTMIMAGIASKTGYNFEFNKGRFIIQPLWLMSYSFVKTLDYTNAAGVRIDSDPLSTIQLHPAIRFIWNTKNGWQPYFTIGMVWNLLNETDVKANGIDLPDMHIKPYVEYGIGLQKLWNDRFSAYGEALVRNGGRNGIALIFGFRMALGKDYSKKTFRGKMNAAEVTNNSKGQTLTPKISLSQSPSRFSTHLPKVEGTAAPKLKSNIVGIRVPVYAKKVKDIDVMNTVPFLK